jgi:hypothetical protein
VLPFIFGYAEAVLVSEPLIDLKQTEADNALFEGEEADDYNEEIDIEGCVKDEAEEAAEDEEAEEANATED